MTFIKIIRYESDLLNFVSLFNDMLMEKDLILCNRDWLCLELPFMNFQSGLLKCRIHSTDHLTIAGFPARLSSSYLKMFSAVGLPQGLSPDGCAWNTSKGWWFYSELPPHLISSTYLAGWTQLPSWGNPFSKFIFSLWSKEDKQSDFDVLTSAKLTTYLGFMSPHRVKLNPISII